MISITGLGFISPLGDNLDAYMDALINLESAIKPIQLFDTGNYTACLGAEIADFDPKKYLTEKGLRYLDKNTKLVLSAAKLAIEDTKNPLINEKEEVGVVLGNTFGCLNSISNFDKMAITKGFTSINPSEFANTVANSSASNVSIKNNAMCMNVTVSSGYTSTLDAVIYACDMIKYERAKVLIAGGVEELCEQLHFAFDKLGVLSNEKEPKSYRGPFDKNSRGIILGEGAGMFILEGDKDTGLSRGKEYGKILGYGKFYEPEGNHKTGMYKAMEKALRNAGISPLDVDAVIASANGNNEMDGNEFEAIAEVFADSGDINVISIQGNVGECYSAKGAFQIIAALGMLEKQVILPTYGCKEPLAHYKNIKLYSKAVYKNIGYILINSFSTDGFYSSIIISK